MIAAPIYLIVVLLAIVVIVAGLIWLGRTVASVAGPLVLVAAVIAVAVFVLSRVAMVGKPQAAPVRAAAAESVGGSSSTAGGIETVPVPTSFSPSDAPLQPNDSSEPSWINEPPQTIDGKFRTHIVAGPYDRVLDCEKELDQKLLAEARKYVEREFGAGLAEPSLEYLRANVVVDDHVEPTKHEFGGVTQEMYQVYRRLEFDEADRNYFAALSRETKVERRLAYAGFGLASVLVLLSTAFGYLRIDQATAGQYRRRLQLASTAVILSLLGGAVAFVRLVPLV